MYTYEHPNDLKVRPVLEKPLIPFTRSPANFMRRPSLPMLRRRMMSGRYPNIGFRPFPPPLYRPDCPIPRGASPDFRYQRTPSPATGVLPLTTQRSSFPSAPPNIFDNNNNNNNNFPLPPRTNMNYSDSQISVESSEQRNQPNELHAQSELWVEALAARGRKYYYNARTRETTWNKPVNVRIIGLDEIKHLSAYPDVEHPRTASIENQNQFVHQQPKNPYGNSFLPRCFSLPPRIIFPPPQNICNPPPIFLTPSVEPIQESAIGYNFNTMIPPPIFPLPVVMGNLLPNNEIVDYNTNVSSVEIDRDLEQIDCQTFIDNKNCSCSESTVTDWNVSESKVPLCAPDNINEINQSEKEEESTLKQNDDESDNKKSKNEDVQNLEHEDSTMTETECISSIKSIENKKQEQQTDKSRPVSSTPVSGTCWCVVWTGDEKVFFYDSTRKMSVWERPDELLNRSDVDKMTKKPPLSIDVKSTKKEVRKTSSDGSDVIKKLKTEDEKNENSDLEENFEFIEKAAMENTAKEGNAQEDKPISEIPNDQRVKMFCEMLVDNRVSAFSTWEKELHKFVFDPRYLLLPAKQRKRVFQSYILTKVGEEKNDRQKEIRCQRERFISLLKEAGVTSKSRFSDIASDYAKDARFKGIEKIKQKENIFNHYVAGLTKKERENEKLEAERKRNFIALLQEQSSLSKHWSEAQKNILNDERYKAIKNEFLKEKIFKEYILGISSNIPLNEKEERINASIRNREEEVKRDLSVHLKDREREQEIHKHTSAISNFKALLDDLIRSSDMSWCSAKKILKGDHRWNFAHCLEAEKREELFNEHIESLNSKKKDQFYRLLDEMRDITLKTSWLDVRKSVLNDSRCTKFSSSERKCEKEFKEYLRKKLSSAKIQFKELLKETKLITHKSKSLLESTNHLKDIEEILSQDKRYLNLDCMRSERRTILLSYIHKLHSAGAPPPPTASDRANHIK